MKKALGFIIAALVLIVLLFVTGTVYTVKEGQQVILTQFGKPIGEPKTDAGLHFKLPFIVKVNVVEKRILAWDGESAQCRPETRPTFRLIPLPVGKLADPLLYFKTLRDERSALSRLDDILGSETRNAVAKHDLLEVVRSTKDRKPERTDLQTEKEAVFEPIKIGRREIEKNLNEIAKTKLDGTSESNSSTFVSRELTTINP
jgi:membrane protease subunit HflC